MRETYPIPDFLRRQPAQPAGPRERPVLFSAPMVRAILAGTKTQTRRPLYTMRKFFSTACFHRDYPPPPVLPPVGKCWALTDWRKAKTGDVLWVREAWRLAYPPTSFSNGIIFRADAGNACGMDEYSDRHRWKPSIHMRRSDSRILLEIVSVRVERLQDISEADAMAEGITTIWPDGPRWDKGPNHYTIPIGNISYNAPTAAGVYSMLWEQINGAGSWDANPWVWAISFRRINA